ncbi:protein-L-histidine N-pros-methyltransferase isoform X2 [Andrena cerasifolii]|uniref:protein-L-histidine N-pros-methyltransferase isoform X2 n=1 Tax=Andrena cerasifolii TaxID=2819439 RepID=UPI004037F342
MAGADPPLRRCTCDIRNLATCSAVSQDAPTSRAVRSYRPHGSLARVLYDKQKADEQLEAYDKTLWYKVDSTKVREDLVRLWIPLGAGPQHDQPDKTAEIFLMKSAERSDSLPLQAWHSLARSALSWFISRTSINGVLELDKWQETGPFNVILCLNLLDRCDRPNTLLRHLKSSLSPGGRLVVALVLPFSPYVEIGERGDHKPSEYLPVKGNGLEGQIASLVDRVFAPLGLKCLVWSKLPYLCEGDLGQAYYFLDDVVFLLEAQPDTSRYLASEWTHIEAQNGQRDDGAPDQTGRERNCNAA